MHEVMFMKIDVMRSYNLNVITSKQAANENPDSFIDWMVDKYYLIF